MMTGLGAVAIGGLQTTGAIGPVRLAHPAIRKRRAWEPGVRVFGQARTIRLMTNLRESRLPIRCRGPRSRSIAPQRAGEVMIRDPCVMRKGTRVHHRTARLRQARKSVV